MGAPSSPQTLGPTPNAPREGASEPPVAGAGSSGEQVLVRHKVQAGETLSSIAKLYDVTVAEIQAANGLDTELIRAGDELVIPVPPSIAVASDEPSPMQVAFRYVVQPGDTIVSIAVRFGSTVEGILAANNIGPNDFIRPEQVLRVPVDGVPAAVLASSEETRTRSPIPTPTIYEAPRLLSPDDESTINRDEAVLFRWISVDLLAANEWYVLRVWPVEGPGGPLPAVWTKATSYRLSSALAPDFGPADRFGWQVSVARVLPDTGEGREIQAAGAPSAVRNFIWR